MFFWRCQIQHVMILYMVTKFKEEKVSSRYILQFDRPIVGLTYRNSDFYILR